MHGERDSSRAQAGKRAPFSDVRVVEIGGGIAAAYAGKLLIDLGACVVKIEPPGGDSLRALGPAPRQAAERGSGLFQYLDAGKRSVAADVARASDRERVAALLGDCDVLLESLGAGRLEMLGDVRRPRVVLRLSSFGQTGPYRDRPATSLTLQAAGGWAARIGTPEGPPYHVGGRIEEYIAGAYGAAAALSAFRQATRTGDPVEVDLSTLECLAGTIPYPMLQKATFDRLGFPVPQRYQPIPGILRAADGLVGINALTGQHWADICTLFEVPELAQKMREAALRGAEWQAFLAKAEPWLAARTAAEVVEHLQAARVSAVQIGNGANLPSLEPFVSRKVFVDQPAGGFLRPRSPLRLHAERDGAGGSPPMVELSPAPRLGEHTAEPFPTRGESFTESIAGRDTARTSTWGGGRNDLPFSGLRVLDLTSFWAGPYLTMYLASLGADVIKVESPRRPDGFRFVAAYPQLGDRWWEQSGVYHATNLGKRAVAIDLDRPDGLALVKRLIADADVVVENYSPRVIENFGLAYDAVRGLAPAAIMLRMPGFGLWGACRDWVGWALTFEQLAGCAFVTGEPAGRMFAPGGFADPVVGMHAAVALQAALAEREATGMGQLVEIAQIEVVASLTAEQAIRHSLTGELMARNGNRAVNAAPQGIYRCAGSDEWLALTVRDDQDWMRLRSVLGDPQWARASELDTRQGRSEHHDAIDTGLTAWTSTRDAREAAEQLLVAGIPAAALLKTDSIYGEPQLDARAYFQTVEHAVTGPLRYPGWPMHFSFLSAPVHPYAGGAPTLGQHNEEILGGVLGLSAGEIQRLRDAGVIGETLG